MCCKLNKYFNIKEMIKDKKEYKAAMARLEELPDDYQYAYHRMCEYMWRFSAGDGYDMLKIQYRLIDTFECAAIDGKDILDIIGENPAFFCDELIKETSNSIEKMREKLNHDILKHIGKGKSSDFDC